MNIDITQIVVAVIGKGGAVTTAINVKNLIKA